VVSTPLGPVYQPKALRRQVEWLLSPEDKDPLIFMGRDGLFRSWLAHHKLACETTKELNVKLHELSDSFQELLQNTAQITLTISNAYTYFENEVGAVANCHKEPAIRFTGHLCILEDIQDDLSNTVRLLRKSGGDIPIILTLSPVRNFHLGMGTNSLSKALLRVAIDRVVNQFSFVHYFPAFEIMMDDLRDYRYYKEDMIHPTEQAAHYIAELFINALFSDPLQKIFREGQKIFKLMAHKPITDTKGKKVSNKLFTEFVKKYWPNSCQKNTTLHNFILRNASDQSF